MSMKLELFDANFIRIGKISQYSYSSYEHDSKGVGSFLINCAKTESLLKILPEVEYILFEEGVMGVFNYEDIGSIEVAQEITIKGYMLKSILSYRTFFPQFSATLPPRTMLSTMVLENFVNSPNPDRNEERMVVEAPVDDTDESVTLQVTGSTVFAEAQKIANESNLVFDITPELQAYDEESEKPTNVKSLVFSSRKIKDLTINNSEGNSPVVFSYSLSNIHTSDFNESKENYKNFAVVAGEGEASLRKVVTLSDEVKRLQADENTLCLLHFEDLTDEARPSVTLTKGSAADILNTNARFGGMSGRLKNNTANSYFQFTNPQVPAGDFTIEWWEYVESIGSGISPAVFASRTTNAYGMMIWYQSTTNTLRMRAGSANDTTYDVIPTNTLVGDVIFDKWVSRAVVRDGKELRTYQNGKLYNKITLTSTAKPSAQTNAWIGKYYKESGAGGVQGYIDEFRVSNVCRYFGEEYELQSAPFSVNGGQVYVSQKGLRRKELFVDARDLQSTDENGKALSDEEYRKLLMLRGLDKLSDYLVVRSVNATVSTSNGKVYKYGEHYQEGDLVTLHIEPLEFYVDIPIAKVEVIEQGSQTYVELTFGNVKNFIKQQLRKENLL